MIWGLLLASKYLLKKNPQSFKCKTEQWNNDLHGQKIAFILYPGLYEL